MEAYRNKARKAGEEGNDELQQRCEVSDIPNDSTAAHENGEFGSRET